MTCGRGAPLHVEGLYEVEAREMQKDGPRGVHCRVDGARHKVARDLQQRGKHVNKGDIARKALHYKDTLHDIVKQ